MASLQFANGGDGLQVWEELDGNILNKQSGGQPTKGGHPVLKLTKLFFFFT
jgi:hypothetical protein